MDKSDKLEVLEVLSALESWGFSTKSLFPDYLHDRIGVIMDKLRKEIIKGE